MPFDILGIWLRGIVAIAALAGGLYLVHAWHVDPHNWESVDVDTVPVTAAEPDPARAQAGPPAAPLRVFRWNPGINRESGLLAAALALLTWSLLGLPIARGITRLTHRAGTDEPKSTRGGDVQLLDRPDGSVIRVETYGPEDAPPIVLTHGWGADSTEWYYAKSHLADRFRLVVWDLPGLGLSKKPDSNDYSLEALAADLEAVLGVAGGRPAVLAGHSIGGMITLTFCRLFPAALGTRVAGLVLVHTTPTNPVRTTQWAGLYTALEKPVIIPLLHLTIAAWPLVWAMNWLSYWNGSFYDATRKGSFAGTETAGQVDFVAAFMPRARPDVLARGMLGMIRYDASETLKAIRIPALVVAGDVDTTTKPEAGAWMTRGIPKAEPLTLAPARHMGLIEHNEGFDAEVGRFVESCQAQAQAVAGVAGAKGHAPKVVDKFAGRARRALRRSRRGH